MPLSKAQLETRFAPNYRARLRESQDHLSFNSSLVVQIAVVAAVVVVTSRWVVVVVNAEKQRFYCCRVVLFTEVIFHGGCRVNASSLPWW